jgi:transaldolase
VNITLVFSQEQAAAAYAATKGAAPGDVYVSPFDGRLDDVNICGMCTIENIIKMYNEKGDGHVEVLMASVRNLEHLLHGIEIGADIITVPFEVLKEWGEKGMPLPTGKINHIDEKKEFVEVPYKELDIEQEASSFDISHGLTDRGLEKFTNDWNNIIKN